MARNMVPYDGNTAVTHVAHATNEVIAIYPITPSSGMGEMADEKSARGEKNIWGAIPTVAELQSEAGASGAVHGALAAGALTTTFTASQGLLLMIPNMYKIAGELKPTCFHVSARSIACQALSIFGDHSDICAARNTGFAFLCSASVQESMDFALIGQAATLASRIPFVHFFEGFRGSHEISKIEELTMDDMKAMIDDELVQKHRALGLSPDHPVLQGTSQNPDVYFQGRESVNKFYDACPQHVQDAMDRFAKIVGRQYHLFDYEGAKDAERVIVVMGSGGDTVSEAVKVLEGNGEKVGLVRVRLFRPFDTAALIDALPATVQKIAVLDRTKEPGSPGEPLYLDVCAAVDLQCVKGTCKLKPDVKIVGGRYGLGSKEFTAAMVKGVYDELKKETPKHGFTIGIEDDVTMTSLPYDPKWSAEPKGVHRCLFYGLGADGTVSANKNSIKMIGELTENFAQGYFVYDSKKAGAMTVSHLRFGPQPIQSRYLVYDADFLACHNFSFLEKYDMLKNLQEGGTFLLNSMYGADEVWEQIPVEVQQKLIDRKAKFYVINGVAIAEKVGLGERINVVMQTAFFKIAGILPIDQAVEAIKKGIKKSYGAKGEKIVEANYKAVDMALDALHQVKVPAQAAGAVHMIPTVPANAPDFVREVSAQLMRQEGDNVKVSQMPVDGSWPTGTTQYEKRNIALDVPVWDPESCIQCGRCSLACPHACIRPKAYDASALSGAPATFKSCDAKGMNGKKYTLQVAVEDCTGCGTCVFQCPVKDKGAIKMERQAPIRCQEQENWDFFLGIPETDPESFKWNTVKGSQFVKPLLEFSGACAGCGETAYVKLATQLFGDRMVMANATGCSSIWGGNLPTTPYATRADGRGPAWNNSLFEDCAELAFGMRLTVDQHTHHALRLLDEVKGLDATLVEGLKTADQGSPDGIEKQRARVDELKKALEGKKDCAKCKDLHSVADYLVKKSVWGVGGDGWAYDIGYGGLDHVLASGKNVNLLVLDTEVYSNTGGQSSKSTPRGAVAKFAAAGKPQPKKDMALLAMSYGNVYVAKCALGSNPNQLVKAMIEAEAYDGPSLILCYSHCIAHGINMTEGFTDQQLAVDSGHWPLLRFNPALAAEGKNPLQLDSKTPTASVGDFEARENRFRVLKKSHPDNAERLLAGAEVDAKVRYNMYKHLSEMDYSGLGRK